MQDAEFGKNRIIIDKINNSTVNINQDIKSSEVLNTGYVKYSITGDTIRKIDSKTLNRKRNYFILSFLTMLLGVGANTVTVSGYYHFPVQYATIAIVIVSILLSLKHYKYFDVWIRSMSGKETMLEGCLAKKDDNGDILLYKKQTKCIYPDCNGMVIVVAAPERECGNHSFVGICSEGGKQHTYTYDGKIGYPAKFDWRQLEKKENGKE